MKTALNHRRLKCTQTEVLLIITKLGESAGSHYAVKRIALMPTLPLFFLRYPALARLHSGTEKSGILKLQHANAYRNDSMQCSVLYQDFCSSSIRVQIVTWRISCILT
jgi:hypothetical protein